MSVWSFLCDCYMVVKFCIKKYGENRGIVKSESVI